MTDTPERQGPITWRRPPGEEGTRLAATVLAAEGARIVVEVDGAQLEATLVDDPETRPAVLRLDEEVTIDGDTVAAIRLPSGVDDAITDAVLAFGDR